MNKFYGKLVVIISTLSILYFPNHLVKAETKSKTTSWIDIIKSLIATKPPVKPRSGGGSRPVFTACVISPNSTVWHTQPLFVWEGSIDKVSLRQNDNPDFWQQDVEYQNHASYDGQPLQPGQAYNLTIDDEQVITFQIMNTQQRNTIITDLQALENNLHNKGASKEDIAQAKANYFEQHKLWSDAVQEIYAVQNPSPELLKLRREIPEKICH